MISGCDVLILSSVDWGEMWHSPQELATRLGRAGNRVLFVENLGIRRPRLRDSRRVVGRLIRLGNTLLRAPRNVSENVHLCSPAALPPFGAPWQRAVNRAWFLPRIRRAAAALGMKRPVLWTLLPTDTCVDLIASFEDDIGAVVYDCGADFSRLAENPAALEAAERAMAARSDAIFVTCDPLAQRFSATPEKVHALPVGVSMESFPLEAPLGSSPAELAALVRPVIGYVGGLHRHLHVELLLALARARPAWSWLFVGAGATDVAALSACPNVHLLGPVRHDRLASYIRTFDVGLVPYRRGPATDTVVPTKINEYLALGKAVVSTDLPPLLAAADLREVVRLAPPDPQAFLAAIEAAIAEGNGAAEVARRRAVALRADWGQRLETMSRILEGKLRPRRSA